jgi:hypothetical protein
LVLQPNTTYFFIMGPQQAYSGTIIGGFDLSEHPGGLFVAMSADTFYHTNTNDFDYLLRGSLVPEPSSLALVGLSAIGLAGYAWRVRRRKAS